MAYRRWKPVGGHRRETLEIREVMKGPFDGRAGSRRPAISSRCEGFAFRGRFCRGRTFVAEALERTTDQRGLARMALQ